MAKHPPAPAHRVKLWFSQVGDSSVAAEEAVRDQLSPSETRRLQGLGAPHRRREYLLSRSLMRHALATTFDHPAHEWQLQERPGAAPLPQPAPADTWLSLSHSGGIVCFAIADCPLGVDIERIRTDRDYSRSADFFMDESERVQLDATSGSARDEFFYRAWCAKEAWYKALAPEQQARTVMRSINYGEVRQGRDGRRLVEGCGDGFRFAAALSDGKTMIEQAHFLAPIGIELEPGPG